MGTQLAFDSSRQAAGVKLVAERLVQYVAHDLRRDQLAHQLL